MAHSPVDDVIAAVPQLFDHKFDIDDVILALCGDDHTANDGRWLLSTETGMLIREEAGAETAQVQDGDNNGHWHIITPLPLTFLNELHTRLKADARLGKLTEEQQAVLAGWLDTFDGLHLLPGYFNNEQHSFCGGWLRERVKDAALDWLDLRELIPPSMRHVRADSLFGAPQTPENLKIKIASDDLN